MKIKPNYIKWLLSELPVLKEKNIIDEPGKNKLERYYIQQLELFDPKSVIITIFSILATILICGGIILIIGYNWSNIPRSYKTILAFLLLMIPQVLCFYYLFIRKKELSIATKETLAGFWAIGFGTTIAFIGQIYQLPENTTAFLFIWAMSTLVILYIFDSIICVPIYLSLIIGFVSSNQIHGDVGYYFLPLLALLIPNYFINYKKSSSVRLSVYNYFFVTASIVGMGISLEKTLPGLWIIIYSNLFGMYYCIGKLLEDKEDSLFYSPFKAAGVMGTAILAYMLTWEWPWKNIGWDYYRTEGNFHELAGMYDFLLTFLFTATVIILSYLLIKKKKSFNKLLPVFGILTFLLYFSVSAGLGTVLAGFIINFFILILCGYSFYSGYKNNSLITINASMFFVTLTIITRFFDDEIGLLGRGIVFILLGITIGIINKYISKKWKK